MPGTSTATTTASGCAPLGAHPAADVELWLSSPIRLALLAIVAILLATLATSIGEIELVSAGGMDERDVDVLWRQGLLWTLWAVVTPPLLWVAIRMGRFISHWPLLVLAHLILATIVGAAFLCAEIAVIEAGQTAEETASFARGVRWSEERGDGERDSRRRRDGRTPGEGDLAAAEPGTSPPDRPIEEGRSSDNGFANRPPGRPPTGPMSRRRWMRRVASFNISTGDLRADFERRWPLRVPRYALVYFSLIGIGLGIRAFLNGRLQERHAARLESDLSRARLDALKGQLHPHFLFNSLHSVGGLIRTSRGDDALTALASIGDLLRTSLDAEPEQFVPLEREIELIRRYLDVETLRLGDRLKITIDVPPELLPAEVPTFIAQPLVENAIKHAVASRSGGGSVLLRARAEDGVRLILDVEDDGPGYAPRAGHAGVGISHVTQRLEALFGGAATLEVGSMPAGSAGTRARLTLPLDDIDGPLDHLDGEAESE
ncbi:Sensor histidine kinase YehU [Planctomycetes bacterium Poly30]|uniref:Sensor histidine kinase YehU n=1 Tax=Saltatorellus ferox TaxID=2528018 RepID=A0A518EUL5_9BACT|nr:Sensor histidine kinase YehU [Planctomycetes bacterium Poly30]